jgi:hypothetical protein
MKITDVEAAMYLYTDAGTNLTAALPPWVAAGGRLFENLLRLPAI